MLERLGHHDPPTLRRGSGPRQLNMPPSTPYGTHELGWSFWAWFWAGIVLLLCLSLGWQWLKNKLAGRMSRLRPRVGFLAPGLGAGLFVLMHSHQPLLDRCLSAVTVGVAIQVGTLIGGLLCIHLAGKLTGGAAALSEPESPALLAAMLLATGMWMWWQIDREATVHELASCVDQVTLDDPLRPSQAVNQCWRDRASRDAADDE